jgi:hypothetical protein
VTGAAAPLAAEGVGLALVVAAVAGGVVIVLLLSVEATESSVVIAGVVRKVALLLSAGVALTSVRCWIMQNFCQSLAPELFSPPPNHEPRTFKSHIYTLRLICTCSVAQALSTATFRTQKDVELTKLFKIAHRVVFRGRRTDFRDFKDRPKIACNSTKTKFFKNLKVVSDSP